MILHKRILTWKDPDIYYIAIPFIRLCDITLWVSKSILKSSITCISQTPQWYHKKRMSFLTYETEFVLFLALLINSVLPMGWDSSHETLIWRKSHRSQITLSAEGISYNIARQVKLTPDSSGSLRHDRRILQVAAFEKCPQARKKDRALLHDYDLCQY